MPSPTKTLFIGLDSADPVLLDRWGDEGLLPNIARLRGQSMRARTRLPPGFGTGTMWISVNTGLAPGTHGRYYGRQFDASTYRTGRYRSQRLEGLSFWHALGDAGRRVAVLDVPVAPLSTVVNGLQVKDWGTHDAIYPMPRTTPADLADELVRRFGSDTVGPCDHSGTTWADHRKLVDGLVDRVERKSELATHLSQLESWDLFMVGFGDAHCVAHQCWHLHDIGHPDYDPAFAREHGDPVQRVYVALDHAIGRLVDGAASDTAVVLFSASGMGPDYTANHHLDEALRRIEGFAPSEGPGRLEALKVAYNSTLPEALRLRLVPLTNQIDEQSKVRDRKSRKFFAIPHNEISGAIRFNVKGRERNGRLEPGPDLEAEIDSLREKLLDLKELSTGRRVVESIVSTPEIYPGDRRDELPDLLVVWDRSAPIMGITSPLIGELRGEKPGVRTGDHRPDGLLWVRAPGLDPGIVQRDVPVEDIAPTVAGFLDVELEADGRPIPELRL